MTSKTTYVRRARLSRIVAAGGIVTLAGIFAINTRAPGLFGVADDQSPANLSATPQGSEPSEDLDAGWDIANLDSWRVDAWVRRFTTDPKVAPRFAIWLDRKPRYEAMISSKLAERGMPQDLIYLAMIESGFNPRARSRAQAGGLWQFIAETGKRYGLRVNRTVDERNHPEKATEAALSYLSDLHDRFGSWYLAAAAYNTGENRVGRHMRTVTGQEKGTDADYYRILHLLPRETRDYVPMMVAAARISKAPAKYGLDEQNSD